MQTSTQHDYYVSRKDMGALKHWYRHRQNQKTDVFEGFLFSEPSVSVPYYVDRSIIPLNWLPLLSDAGDQDPIGKRIGRHVNFQQLEVRLSVHCFRPTSIRVMIVYDTQPVQLLNNYTETELNSWRIAIGESLFGQGYITQVNPGDPNSNYVNNGFYCMPLFDVQKRYEIIFDQCMHYEGSGIMKQWQSTTTGLNLQSDNPNTVTNPKTMFLYTPKVAITTITPETTFSSNITLDAFELDAALDADLVIAGGTAATGPVSGPITGTAEGTSEVVDLNLTTTQQQFDATAENPPIQNVFVGNLYQTDPTTSLYTQEQCEYIRSMTIKIPDLDINSIWDGTLEHNISSGGFYLCIWPEIDALSEPVDGENAQNEFATVYYQLSYNDNFLEGSYGFSKKNHIRERI